MGREGDGYIAVARHCTEKIDGVFTCDDQDGQVWAVVVGNDDMYGTVSPPFLRQFKSRLFLI